MVWAAVSAFCALFSVIYNHYGHGIHSFFMSFLFLWPFLGAAWYLLLPLAVSLHPSRLSKNMMNAGLATITAGSLLRGIFEIAGTSSPYENEFFFLGVTLCAFSIPFLFRYRGHRP